MKNGIIITAVLFFLFISFADAFSVATLYSEGYPLRMKPGETKDTFFLLRNVIEGDSDINIKSELIKGQDIAVLIDGPKTYNVPFGSEIEVPVRIKMPDNAEVGNQYRVGAIFRPSAGKLAEGGNIEFIVNIGKSFPIVIVKEEEEPREKITLTIEDEGGLVEKLAPFVKGKKGIWLGLIFVLFIGIIIVGIIIIFILRSRNAVIRDLSSNQSNLSS